MAETVTTIQQAPDYLKPGIEKFLEGATAQAGQAMDTSKFAPSVVGLGALQQQHNNKQQHKLVLVHYNLILIQEQYPVFKEQVLQDFNHFYQMRKLL